ncbi:YgiT-type zinc finger domain protein [[Clostridium] methylpentosum DSM 5476]|uniref:YgiT-type zinc finger domain protein n=1 Tax=[Clostridium] methylpentosum DSM 5476 TaxID=537013 RepID=C0EDT9_9FIRM|nr:YgiT-type zinc finger domain protein [[Clostridium] methylpentosum DSM 5476]MEE1490491.1 type II toxin-antitoxin system MqsA family antitoxin [Massilioclostridium sp.]
MGCFFCKGTLKNSFTNHVVNLQNCIIIIKNVPCEECTQCGETFYSDDVAEQLEEIVNKFKKMVRDVAIFDYANMVA